MLTNTERQQIVEEVNAGTYGIDEALDDIAAAQKGEEVRKALYAEALVLNREGHAGSTDMIARQQVANLQTSVNGQISTLRTEVGEDIDDLETALNSGLAAQNGRIAAQNATIANVVKNYNLEYGSETLWEATGETGLLASGTTATLSKDVSNFDYVDIYSFCGNSNVLDTVPVDAKLQSSQGYALRWVNLSDPDSGSYKAYVRIIETRLHIIGTTLTIDHQVTYRNGEEVTISGAEITQSNRSTYMGELGIMKIVGRKITANTEIEDVRIGADGTEYASAGQAVRAQVTALESAIPAVDSTLSTQGAAADAKIVGDKLTNVKEDLKSVEESLSNGFIRIANRYIASDGTLGLANAYDVLCFRVLPSMTIEKIVSTDAIVYGFYAVEPTTEAVTYNSSRVVTSGSTITNVTVPQTCYWIGVRVPTGTTATITPNSFVIKYIKNYLDALDQNYEVTTTYSSGVVHTGGVNPSNNVSHSDYVEVEPFNVYRIDNIYRNDNNIIIYYNANKEYIMAEKLPQQLSQTISSFVFSVPSGVAYMSFNVTNANLSTVKITRIVNTEINDTPIYLGTFTAGYINANNKVSTSDALSYSDYINVTYGKTLVIKKAYPQSVRMIFMYNADKNYIGSIDVDATGSSVAEFLFTVPNTCAYIRFNVTNSNTSSVSLAYRVSTYAGAHDESSVFVNNFLKTVGAKVNRPFAAIKSAGPLCVIIDDDTSSMYQVDKFHDLCEQNAVVGVYACITSYLDSITGLEAKLLNYEKEGFQTIVHCTQQTRIYDPTDEMYSVPAMESDFINACHRMQTAGFYDWKYWAYPYGSFTNEHIRIARKTGMKCAMTVPNLEYIGFTDAVTDVRGRYTMKRMELYPTDAAGNQTLSDIKNQMDLCAKNNGLLIICTHMYQWDEQSDFTRFDQMVQYGKTKGLRFTTISEAMSYWKHLYDLYEAF